MGPEVCYPEQKLPLGTKEEQSCSFNKKDGKDEEGSILFLIKKNFNTKNTLVPLNNQSNVFPIKHYIQESDMSLRTAFLV